MNQINTETTIVPRKKWVWGAGLVIFCLTVIVLYGYFFPGLILDTANTAGHSSAESDPFNEGRQHGQILGRLIGGKLLIIFAAFYLLFGRKHGVAKGIVAFFALLFALVISHEIANERQKTMIAGREKISRQFEQYATDFSARLKALRTDCTNELTKAGWEDILKIERLQAANALEAGEQIIRNAKTIIGKCKDQENSLFADVQQEINQLDAPEKAKQEYGSGFVFGLSKSADKRKAIQDYNDKIFAEIESAFLLLSEKKGRWHIKNGEIIFTRDAELNAFNAHMAVIIKLASELEPIEKQSAGKISSKADAADQGNAK